MKFESVALAEVADIVQGGRHGLSGNHFVADGGGFPAYGAGGLNGHLSTFEFDRSAVILSSIGARCGKCFFATGKWSSLANTQVIMPDERKVDTRYLWYVLNEEKSWPRSGTAQPFIKPSVVKARRVRLPALKEQRRIADVLDTADGVRRKREQLIDLADKLIYSLFIENFGDPIRNQSNWRVMPLCEICTPKQWPTIQSSEFTVSGFPVHGANGIVGRYHEFNHEDPTVLIACRGTCGAINVSPPMCYVTGNAMALDSPVLDVVDISYLEWVLRVRGLADTITGSSQPQITRQSLQRVVLPVPPLLQQQRFARLVSAIRAIQGRYICAAEEAQAMCGLLLRKLVREE